MFKSSNANLNGHDARVQKFEYEFKWMTCDILGNGAHVLGHCRSSLGSGSYKQRIPNIFRACTEYAPNIVGGLGHINKRHDM